MTPIHCPELSPHISIRAILGETSLKRLGRVIVYLLLALVAIVLARRTGNLEVMRWSALAFLIFLLLFVQEADRFGDLINRIQRFHQNPHWEFVAIEVGPGKYFQYPRPYGRLFSLKRAWTFQGFSQRRYLLALSHDDSDVDFLPLDPELDLFQGIDSAEKRMLREVLDDALYDAVPKL